jgi:predicted negative regulator of RcsB-dependent stress response
LYASSRGIRGAPEAIGCRHECFPTISNLKADKVRFEKVIAEAQKTISSYPNTHAASVAQYYEGIAQDGLGDQANAVKNLEEVIGRGDPEVKPVAQFALAGLYKRHGELQKAIDILKQLEAAGTYSVSAVNYELGATAEAANQKDVAQGAIPRSLRIRQILRFVRMPRLL